MCAGNAQRNAEHEAAKRQREADAVAAQRQAEMNRLAAERQATAVAQQAQLLEMQQQAAAEKGLQQAEVDRLQAQQQERLGGLRSMGTAVSQSLRILGSAGSQQAPWHHVRRRKPVPDQLLHPCEWVQPVRAGALAPTSRCNSWPQQKLATALSSQTATTISAERGHRRG
jgi:hypothetical protein